MSRFNKNTLLLLPLLSLLSMSPRDIEKKFVSRSIASVECKDLKDAVEKAKCEKDAKLETKLPDVSVIPSKIEVEPMKPILAKVPDLTIDAKPSLDDKKEEPKKEVVVVKEEPKKEVVVVKEEPKKEVVVVKEEPKKEVVVVKEEPKKEVIVVKEEPKKDVIVVKDESKKEIVVLKEEPKKDDIETKKEEPKKEEKVALYPKYDSLATKVDLAQIKKDDDLTLDKSIQNFEALKATLIKVREDFKKNSSVKADVDAQKILLEGYVSEVVKLEAELKSLKSKKLVCLEEEDTFKKFIQDYKSSLEGLLSDLESNQALVAKAEGKEEPKKDVVVVAESKKEEPKKEEPKKEVAKEEAKKEEKCEATDSVKVLTAQVDKLVKDQNDIMKSMLAMSQMMMMQMMQSMQLMQMKQESATTTQQQYPYLSNNTGSWLYVPGLQQQGLQQQGLQLQGQQPQLQQPQVQQPQQAQSFFSQPNLDPNQLRQQQAQQTPGQYNIDPRLQTGAHQSGNFGFEPFFFDFQKRS